MKKLSFSETESKNFKKYFNIKNIPGKWDELYIKKAIKYIKYIKWVPGLKMVGVGNSISMNYGKESSDIDLFIVTSKKRLWSTRFIVTLVYTILGVRKTSKKHSGKLCLSFFSTIEGLNFNKFVLEKDIYLYFWIINLIPILDYDNTYSLFIKENSKWADLFKYEDKIKSNKKNIKIQNNKKNKEIIIGDFFENILKMVWGKKTVSSYKKLGKPFGIIINDKILKFHNNDKRNEIRNNILGNFF